MLLLNIYNGRERTLIIATKPQGKVWKVSKNIMS
jgi:hypothetical protein